MSLTALVLGIGWVGMSQDRTGLDPRLVDIVAGVVSVLFTGLVAWWAQKRTRELTSTEWVARGVARGKRRERRSHGVP